MCFATIRLSKTMPAGELLIGTIYFYREYGAVPSIGESEECQQKAIGNSSG